jgi:hypothetical protein
VVARTLEPPDRGATPAGAVSVDALWTGVRGHTGHGPLVWTAPTEGAGPLSEIDVAG